MMVDVTTATILKSEETRQVRARKFQMVACVSFLGKDNMKLDFIVHISLQNGQSWDGGGGGEGGSESRKCPYAIELTVKRLVLALAPKKTSIMSRLLPNLEDIIK